MDPPVYPKPPVHLNVGREALLAVAAATSWFTKEQLDDIDTWFLEAYHTMHSGFAITSSHSSDYPRLNEVADCGETEDWIQNFPEDDLRDAVLEKLRPRRPRMPRNAPFSISLERCLCDLLYV